MKNIIILVAISIGAISCIGTSKLKFGKYYSLNKGNEYNLVIKKDSTFFYKKSNTIVSTQCSGRWILHGDTLLLKCGEDSLSTKLSSGYMDEREKVLMVRNGKLKMKKVTLKLKEQQK